MYCQSIGKALAKLLQTLTHYLPAFLLQAGRILLVRFNLLTMRFESIAKRLARRSLMYNRISHLRAFLLQAGRILPLRCDLLTMRLESIAKVLAERMRKYYRTSWFCSRPCTSRLQGRC